MKKTSVIIMSLFLISACQLVSEPYDWRVSKPNEEPAFSPSKVDFENAYNLIFKPKCLRCHSLQTKSEGDMDFDTLERVQYFLFDIQRVVDDNSMPPKRGLSPKERAFLNKWLAAGAPLEEEASTSTEN